MGFSKKNKINIDKKYVDDLLDIEEGVAVIALIKEHMDENSEFVLNDLQKKVCVTKIKEISKRSFYFFSKYVLGFDLLTVQTHKRWCDNLQGTLNDIKKIMRLKPRATYKTTIYGVSFILWVWSCISTKIRIFYTSSNALLLEEVSDKITQFLQPNEESVFQFVFSVRRDDVGKFAPKNTGDVFNIVGRSGKGFSLILRTSGGSTVGIHPNLIIVDDACGQEDRESTPIREKKKTWFDTLTPLIVPYSVNNSLIIEHVIYVATVWHKSDLTNHIIKSNKELEGKDKWDIEIEKIEDGHGNSNYPEFVSNEKIASIKANISLEFFYCQYMNEALPEGMRLFVERRMHFVIPESISLHEGNLSCFFDPSRGKIYSDWPAVIFTLFKDNTLYIIKALDKEKIELATLIPIIANENKILGVSQMYYEDNGVSLIKENLIEAHNKINHYITIDGITHNSNKHERILSMQPDMYSGFVRFLSDWKTRYPQMMDQVFCYPGGDYDDFPDLIEMAVSVHKQSCFSFTRYEGIY